MSTRAKVVTVPIEAWWRIYLEPKRPRHRFAETRVRDTGVFKVTNVQEWTCFSIHSACVINDVRSRHYFNQTGISAELEPVSTNWNGVTWRDVALRRTQGLVKNRNNICQKIILVYKSTKYLLWNSTRHAHGQSGFPKSVCLLDSQWPT